MNPAAPDLIALARRIIWFEPPERALADRRRFLACLLTHETAEDVEEARRHFSEDDFRDALENPHRASFDPRSWAYWNVMAGRDPPRSMPRRVIP